MTSTKVFRLLPGLLTMLIVALTLAGCGGSSDSGSAMTPVTGAPPQDSSSCSDDCGTVLVGLTDADGDFLQYAVKVNSLSLTRADGVRIETLPQSVVVDFTQYTELTEFLTAATVPPGTYRSAEITLDYADAGVAVELDGEPTQPRLVDTVGLPLGIETLQLRLSEDHPLVVLPGLPSIMIVDFDLAASHEVDLTTIPVTVTAAPLLVADIDPIDNKEMRLRGPLVSVDLDHSSFIVALRPFWGWNGDFGRATVYTQDDTAFEIDGSSFSGAEGLAAMAALPAGTPILSFGILDVPQRRFLAKEVYAGTSVPGHAADIVRGVIARRTDNVLHLRGVTVIRERSAVVFRDNVEVLVGPETTVRKAGDPAFDGDSNALSVGQRIIAYGRVVDDTPEERLLDATGGTIRMLRTTVTGIANDILDGQINLDLQKIAGRDAERYDFTGTGMPGQDADPDNYEIHTGILDTSGLTIGGAVRVSGFVTGFGLAPPDFAATTIADFSTVRAQLFVGWNPATATPFLTMGPEGLVIDLGNPDIGVRHHLVRGGIVTDLLTLENASILPRNDRPGLYGIQDRGSITLQTDFALFTRDLAGQLGAGKTVRSVYAHGFWSDLDSEIEAPRILIRLN